MPIKRRAQLTAPAVDETAVETPAVPTSGIRRRGSVSAPPAGGSSEGSSWPAIGATLGGGAALAATAALAHSPNAPAVVKKGLEYANAARQQLMLSGWAPLKSILGNVGAAVAESAESRSLNPLKEMLSMETLRDAKAAWDSGGSTSEAARGVTIPFLSTPGRVMGAFDEAAQKALQRSGMSSNEAAHAVFQTPLGENFGNMGKAFEDNPAASYLIPFRRTPFNQFYEGFKTMGKENRDLPVLASYMGAGGAHGYATADEKYPVSLPLAVAASAKYGVPYSIGAIAGRILAGKKDAGNAATGITPVSEYGITQSIQDPAAPFTEPAALRVLKQLSGR